MTKNQPKRQVPNQYEYQVLTGTWDGPPGAALFQAVEFCMDFGWLRGYSEDGKPTLTDLGHEVVKAYQAEENRKRIDVI